MSWSLSAVIRTGSPDAKTKVARLFDKVNLANDAERAIKDQIGATVQQLLDANGPGQLIKLDASGSGYDGKQIAGFKFEPIYGTVIE